MLQLRYLLWVLVGFFSLYSAAQAENKIPPHVHFMHLDGYNSNVFKALLHTGKLPHFEFLLNRGKISYENSTVDKSETMKVIQSYLTSQYDTKVVAWWQWDRESIDFKNFWIDPTEVLNYALGFEFPHQPTIFDYVAAKGLGVLSGFGLHRRSVPFEYYGRVYFEGLEAAKVNHDYFHQAHTTMSELLHLYTRHVEKEKVAPAFVMSLLAPADEYAHMQGVTTDLELENFCIQRDLGEHYQQVMFPILDEEYVNQSEIFNKYFTKIETNWLGKINQICFDIPKIQVYEGDDRKDYMRSVNSNYVLAMMLVDWELGRLIETLRSIEYKNGTPYLAAAPYGIKGYEPGAEETLFENTLFLFSGDHGMVDSPYKMGDMHAKTPKASKVLNWIEYLNCRMGFATPRLEDEMNDPQNSKEKHLELQKLNGDCLQSMENIRDGKLQRENIALTKKTKMGVDFTFLPEALRTPFLNRKLSQDIQELVTKGETWSKHFLAVVKEEATYGVYQDYWWMGPLRSTLVQPKIDHAFEHFSPSANKPLVSAYLKGEEKYVEWELQYLKRFYNQHVRLVYGGGALNNAEIFIPGWDKQENNYSWQIRPSYAEILDYKTKEDGENIVDAILAHPGVDLIFIRKENEVLKKNTTLPSVMTIKVMDREKNSGEIVVSRDKTSEQLLYTYEVDEGSRDPLGYSLDKTFRGTYREWNELSVKSNFKYHNAVGGIGRYLYSTNSAIGDILVNHTSGYNFGDNDGGHGGLLRDEKLTVMIASHPQMAPGELFTKQTYCTDGGSEVQKCKDKKTPPSVLDIAPTAIQFLFPDSGRNALGEFAASKEYKKHLRKWITNQKVEILTEYGDLLKNLQEHSGYIKAPLHYSKFRNYLERILKVLSPKVLEEAEKIQKMEVEGDLLDLNL